MSAMQNNVDIWQMWSSIVSAKPTMGCENWADTQHCPPTVSSLRPRSRHQRRCCSRRTSSRRRRPATCASCLCQRTGSRWRRARRPACRWSPSPRWAAPPPLTPALPPLPPALPPWPHKAASLPVVTLSKVSRPAPTDPRPAPLTSQGGQPAGGHPLQGEPPCPHWPPPCPPDLARQPACRWSPSPRWAAPPPLTPALPPWPHKAASLPVVTLSKVSRPAPTDPRPAPLTSQGGQPAGGHPLQGEPPRPHWPPPCPPDLTRRPACRWSPSPRWAAPPPLTPALPPRPHKAASLPVVTLSKVSRPAPTDPRPAPLTSQGGQPAGGHPLQGEPPRPHWPPPCPPDLTRRPACRWSPSPRWAAPPPLTPALPPWPHKAASLPVVTLSKVSRPAPTDPRPAPLTSQGGQPAGGHPLQGEPPRPHWPPPCPPDLTRRPACRWSPSPRWARPAPTDPRPAPLTSQGGQPAGGRPLQGEPPRPHWPPPCPPDLTRRPACRWSPSPRWAAPPPLTPALPPWPHKAASLPVVALSKVSRPAPTDPRPAPTAPRPAPLTSQGGQPAGGHPLQGEPPRPHWPPPCPPDLTRRPACRWSPSPRWAAPPPLTPALPPRPHKAASLPVVTLSKVSRPAPTDPRPAPLTSQGGQPAGGHPLQGEPPRPHWPPPCPPDLTRRPACRWSPSPRWARPAPTDPRPAPLTSQGGQPAGGHPLQGEPPRPHWPPPCPPDLTRRPACRWSPSPRWAAPPPLTPALPPWPHKAASLPVVTLSKVSRPAPTDPRPAPLTSQGGQPAGGHPLQGEPPRPHWPPPCPPDLTRRPACRWSPSPRWAAPPPLTPALPPWPHKAASLPVVALSKVSRPAPTDPRPAPLTSQGGQPAGGHPLQGEPPRPHWPPPCPPDLTRRPACRWSPSPRWAALPPLTPALPPWPRKAASLPVVALSKVSRPAPTDPRPAPLTSQGGQPAGGHPLQGEPPRPHWPPPCPPDLTRRPACRWSPSPRWARPAPTDPRHLLKGVILVTMSAALHLLYGTI